MNFGSQESRYLSFVLVGAHLTNEGGVVDQPIFGSFRWSLKVIIINNKMVD